MTEAGPRSGRSALIAGMLVLYVVWGSTYLGIRISVETIPPLLSVAARFSISGLMLVGLLAMRGRIGALRMTRRDLGGAATAGIWMLAGGIGLITIAETRVPSGVAAVIASATALAVPVYRRLGGEHLRPLLVFGVLLGFAGVALLFLPGSQPAGVPIPWLALVAGSMLAWSSGSFYSRRLPQPADSVARAAAQMPAAGLVCAVAAVLRGELADLDLEMVSARSVAALLYLAVVSALAFTVYLWLLDTVPISIVTTHQFVNPVVAIALGVVVLGEVLEPVFVIGALSVVAAVVLVVRAETRPEHRPPGAAHRSIRQRPTDRPPPS